MALISLSTARPIHPNAFMMRSAAVRLSSGVVATVLLYAIVKFNVRLSRVDFFIIFTSDYPDFHLTGKQRQEQRSAKVLVQPVK